MTEETMSIVRELLTLQKAENRCALLATVGDMGLLRQLLDHFGGYGPHFPDGRANCTFISARMRDLEHREQSLAVLAQEAAHVAS